MTILIVEDNQPMRQMIHTLIAPITDEIFECGDGETAFEMYKANRPDWTLMDIDLPNIDGLSATAMIIKEFPAANILIVTNYDEADLRQAANDAGAKHYLLKDDLLAVRRFLENIQTKGDVKL